MPRGGKRAGAGRKVGYRKPPYQSLEKRHRIEQANAQTRGLIRHGLTPLDVMTKTMQGYVAAAEILGKRVLEVDERIITQLGLLAKASDIAKDAAPYVHPRLANIEHSGNDKKPVRHHMTVEFVKP